VARVAVDLTPILPAGQNGGAKTSTLFLLDTLARLAPDWDFCLLTAQEAHDELACLDRANVSRVCVAGGDSHGAKGRLKRAIGSVTPRLLLEPAVRSYRSLLSVAGFGLLARLGANLLFSPLTSPTFYERGVPAVTVVTDLQFYFYPDFFDESDREQRRRSFSTACRRSERIICISDYVRGTVIDVGHIDPSRCVCVHHRLGGRLAPTEDPALYVRLNIRRGRYLLYPANFWPHKNHERLIQAFRLYHQQVRSSDLRLVCCGATGTTGRRVQEAALDAGLIDQVVFPGYVIDRELEGLLAGCKALIFPSLYEGFGMPILEAMEAGRPVLASNTTSLPEIGGDAFLSFDPTDVDDIARAIACIENDAALVARLTERGRERAASFGSPKQMAEEYLSVFRAAIDSN
jgi:glycosyltransferase involved in cell wall biosynthesis